MSEAKDNLALVKETYRRWNDEKGTAFDFWMNLLDEDVDFRSLGAGAVGLEFTEDRRNKDSVRAYFEGLAADWEMLHYTPKDYISEGDRVVMLGACGWRHRHSGKEIETPKADFFRFRDGKVVEFYEFFDTAAAMAATK